MGLPNSGDKNNAVLRFVTRKITVPGGDNHVGKCCLIFYHDQSFTSIELIKDTKNGLPAAYPYKNNVMSSTMYADDELSLSRRDADSSRRLQFAQHIPPEGG